MLTGRPNCPYLISPRGFTATSLGDIPSKHLTGFPGALTGFSTYVCACQERNKVDVLWALSGPSSGKRPVLIPLGIFLQSVSAESGWDGEALKSLSPTTDKPQCVTAWAQEAGEVSVCNTVFTRPRAFLSHLPSSLWVNWEHCFQEESDKKWLGGFLRILFDISASAWSTLRRTG